jgi:TRAP-type transport system periplasmic protein
MIDNFGNCVRRVALASAIGAALMASGAASAQDKQSFVMKMGSLTINDQVHQWLKYFAAELEAKSGGRIKGEIYPSGQLGSAPREIEGTQFGSIQLCIFPPDFFSGIDERFEVGSAPGTFKSMEHVAHVVADKEFRTAFLGLGANKGLMGIALFVNAPVTIITRVPAKRLADFKGLKLRILASDFQVEQIKRLGATQVAMSLGDVMPALQQGTIDGALASIPAFTPLHFYDAAKYMTETGQYYVLIVAEMSKKWYDTLPPDLQKVVLAAADKASTEIVPWQKDDIAKQRKTWLEHGELFQLPPDEQAKMMASMATIGDDVGARRPPIKEMFDILKAAVKRNPD